MSALLYNAQNLCLDVFWKYIHLVVTRCVREAIQNGFYAGAASGFASAAGVYAAQTFSPWFKSK